MTGNLAKWLLPVMGTMLAALVGVAWTLTSSRIEAAEQAAISVRSALDGKAQAIDAYRDEVGALKVAVAEVRASMITRVDLERSRDKVRADVDKMGERLSEQLKDLRGDVRRSGRR